MKLDFEVLGQSIAVLSEDGLADPTPFRFVIDLRKAHELAEDPAAAYKDKGIQYYRMPIDAASISEQDLDHLRRELYRAAGPYAVVSKGGKRAAALVLMHAARSQGWGASEALEKCPEVQRDPVLKKHVESYLERHQDRAARHWSKEVR